MADSRGEAGEVTHKLPGYFLIAAIWLLLFLRGYPTPFIDDLAYIGAALNLAHHQVYSNPYCPSLASVDSTGRFFAYMPLHSYVLAAWLRLFGIGFLALSSFYTLTAALVSALLYRLMPPQPRLASAFTALGITVLVFLLLGGAGMRPDSLGLVFLCFGLDAVRSRGAALFFLKNLSLACAVITFPNVASLALLISAVTLVYRLQSKPWSLANFIRTSLPIALAYSLAFLLMLGCIDFHLGDFLHSLRLGQHFATLGVQERNAHLLSPYQIAKWFLIQPACLALLVGLIWSESKKPAPRFLFPCTALLAFLALFWASLHSASGAHVWAFACLLFSLHVIASRFWKPLPVLIWSIAVGIFLLGHGHTALEGLFASSPDPRLNSPLIARLKTSPAPLYIDCYALREIFDYRLPPHTYGFETGSRVDWEPPDSLAKLLAGTSLVSVKSEISGAVIFPPDRHWQSLRLLGFRIAPLCANPYDLVLMSR